MPPARAANLPFRPRQAQAVLVHAAVPGWTADVDDVTAPAVTTDDGDLFTLPEVRARIDALAQELARLDRDRRMFAKAFRIAVAREAYEALLAEATRLAARPVRAAGATVVTDLDVAVDPVPGRRCEILDL